MHRHPYSSRSFPLFIAILLIVLPAWRVCRAQIASTADITVLESTRDRIVIEARFDYAESPLSPEKEECFLGFPAREYEVTATDAVYTRYDSSNRLIDDDYIPAEGELPPGHPALDVRVSTGFCHDRVIGRIEFNRKVVPQTAGGWNGVLNIRRMRVTIEFHGAGLPGFSAVPPNTPEDPLGFKPLFRTLLANSDASMDYRVRQEFREESGGEFYDAVEGASETGGVWKFSTDREGVHRIAGDVLSRAGLVGLPRESIRVWREGVEIPIVWTGSAGGTVSERNTLCFYEDRAGTDYSKERPYWITAGAGRREAPAPLVAGCTASATDIPAFRESQYIGEKNIMPLRQAQFAGTWFIDALVGNRAHNYSFDLPSATGETVDFHLVLRNALPDELVVEARVNGASAATVTVGGLRSGGDRREFDFSFPREGLAPQGNKLSLRITNEHRGPAPGAWEGLYIEEMRITHWRTPRAVDGRLRLRFPADATGCVRFQVAGFGGKDVEAFQLEPEFRPLSGLPTDLSAGLSLALERPVTLEFLEPETAVPVDNIERFEGLSLRRKENAADYVIISHERFLDTLGELVERRRRLGYRVKLIDVDTVYDEFSFGVPDPHAIRRFIRFALDEWGRPLPAMVLLVGDAFWDYANRTGSEYPNLVPTFLPPDRATDPGSDVWFARAVAVTAAGRTSDPPDVFLARFPVRTLEELRIVLDKDVRYEEGADPGPWRSRALLVSDHTFEESSREVAKQSIPGWMETDFLDYRDYPLEDHYRIQMIRPDTKGQTKDSPQATEDLVRKINRGVLLWDYFGHGGAYVLSKGGLFIGNDRYDTDVLRLHNSRRLPFFTSLSCLTGYFYLNSQWEYSLGESLLLSPGGAIATLTPTHYGSSPGELRLSQRLKQGFFGVPRARIGEGVGYAQIAAILSGGMESTVHQFIFFGDPAVKLDTPGATVDLEIAQESESPAGRNVTVRWPAGIVDAGTAAFSLTNPARDRTLWEYEIPLPPGGREAEVTVPALGADDEGVLDLYAWDPETGADFAGSALLPAVDPSVRFAPADTVLEATHGELSGFVSVRNETFREERDLLLTVHLDGKVFLQESLPVLRPRGRLFRRVRVPADPGRHDALLTVAIGGRELDRRPVSFAVPDATAPAVPVFSSEGLSVRLVSEDLDRAVRPGGVFVPGAPAEVSARLINPSLGTTASYDWVLSDGGDRDVARVQVPPLAPGESHSVSAKWKIPKPGECTLRAELVAGSTDEAARGPAAAVEKTIRIGGYPDLVLTEPGLQYEPKDPLEGQSIRFTVEVKNQGEMPAAEFSLAVSEVRENGTRSLLRQQAEGITSVVWPRHRGILRPGESTRMSVLWHPSDNVGRRRFAAVVDNTNEISEADDSNNEAEVEIDFRPGFITLKKQREAAWRKLDFSGAEEANRKMAALLDRQLEDVGGDRTWMDYDWFAQRGFCGLVSGDLDRAAEVLDWGIELIPGYIANYQLRAAVELRRGHAAAARILVASGVEEGRFNHYWEGDLRTDDPLYQTAEAKLNEGDRIAAEKALGKCVGQTPVNSDAWRLLYQVRSDLGMPEAALDALLGFNDARPAGETRTIEWYQSMYETLVYRLNRPGEGRYWIDKAIEDYPTDSRFRFLLPYLDYVEGMDPAEVNDRAWSVLKEWRTLRGLVAAMHLLIVRLDFDMDDLNAIPRDYSNFVFHSSKTSVLSGFRAWPRVSAAKVETNPNLRVFTGETMELLPETPMAFLLEKSEVGEPATLPEPATMELPVTLTVDLGFPRRSDGCLLSLDEPFPQDLKVSLLTVDEACMAEKEAAKPARIRDTNIFAARFPPIRSRYWRLRLVSEADPPSPLHLRDVLLLEPRPPKPE